MSEPGELSISELRRKRAESAVGGPAPAEAAEPAPATVVNAAVPAARVRESGGGGEDFELPVDPWRLVAALKRRWHWLLLAGCVFGAAGGWAGHLVSDFNLAITLILRDPSTAFVAGLEGESFKPQQFSVRTLVSLIQSPELAHRVAGKAQPPLDEKQLRTRVTASQERDTDLLLLRVRGRHKGELVDLANLYAREAVQMSRELQLNEASRMNKFYQDKLLAADKDLKSVNDELMTFQSEVKLVDPETETQTYMRQLGDILSRHNNARIEAEMVDLQVAALQQELARHTAEPERLRAARERLETLLTRYTDAYPEVQSARREVAALETQAAEARTNMMAAPKFPENSLANAVYLRLLDLRTRKATLEKELQELDALKQDVQGKLNSISREALRYALIKARLDSLKRSRELLATRQREAQLYEDNSQGYFRVFAPMTLQDVDAKSRRMKMGLMGALGFVLGVLLIAAVVLAREALDDRLKTAADVERVTGLPVLATLGDLGRMTAEEKERWAFRTWTILSGKLTASANRGLVCGVISSTAGEGRTTWIKLLVTAASQRGLRVLTVATRPSAPAGEPERDNATTASQQAFTRHVDEALAKTDVPVSATTLTPQVLAFPAEVAKQLNDPHAPPVAHIPLPGWVWNLERRKQWQSALMHWRGIESLVLLVELPPATVPEAVLLAENLPQLLWLVDSGKARARETKQQLETLRHARCRLVGAVLNHEPPPPMRL